MDKKLIKRGNSVKKLISGILAIAMLTCVTIGLSGCSLAEDYLPEYETEYFRYAVRTKMDGTKEGYLVGFTELGAEQEYLILPNEIDGVPIVNFGYWRNSGMYGSERVGMIRAANLKKLFVPFRVENDLWDAAACYGSLDNCYHIQWKNYFESRMSFNGLILSYKAAEIYFKKEYQNYIQGGSTFYRLANVIYDLNYEEAPDDGYYWVDCYDNSTVEFIPPKPARAGYRFDGWYKEASCENEWDFKTDMTGAEIIIKKGSTLEDYLDCEITRLYAKWIKN